MKRTGTVLLLMLFSFFSNINSEEIKHFNSPGWYPLAIKEPKTGEIYGVSIDIMNEIARELNITATYVDVPWLRGFYMLEEGELDVCSGAYDNSERREKFFYSISFLKNETRIFVKKSEKFKFQKLDDLKGKRLGKTLGASFGDDFDSYAKDNIRLFENREGKEKLFQMLLKDRFEGVIMDYFDGMYFLKEHNLLDKIVPLEHPVNSVEVYLLISKKSKYKVEDIDRILQVLIDNGTVARIISNY